MWRTHAGRAVNHIQHRRSWLWATPDRRISAPCHPADSRRTSSSASAMRPPHVSPGAVTAAPDVARDVFAGFELVEADRHGRGDTGPEGRSRSRRSVLRVATSAVPTAPSVHARAPRQGSIQRWRPRSRSPAALNWSAGVTRRTRRARRAPRGPRPFASSPTRSADEFRGAGSTTVRALGRVRRPNANQSAL
jgi:hypothetical protein